MFFSFGRKPAHTQSVARFGSIKASIFSKDDRPSAGPKMGRSGVQLEAAAESDPWPSPEADVAGPLGSPQPVEAVAGDVDCGVRLLTFDAKGERLEA